MRSSLVVLIALLPEALFAQQVVTNRALSSERVRVGEPPGARAAMAARAQRPPVLDGRGDDAVWVGATVIDSFRTFDPIENGAPRFRTEARVAYDEHNLYVLVRAFDARPDSIVALLSRRDVRTASDQVKVMIDSYHDRRTGFEFAVNPAGVKRDFAIINDGEEDDSWDAVWDVATRVDSLGWVAEFRIPFNQLRYPGGPTHTFGLMLSRDIARYNERLSWPEFKRSQGGISSQFGDVAGIDGIASPRRLEIAPYTVAKTLNAPRDASGSSYTQRSRLTAGGDLKYGITSNLTLDATVNPDFGQVESDPSVLNLSAFESFFPEKRPFFLEGQGLFRFDVNCNDGMCSGLFYSRRIGRSPQLSDVYSDVANPTSTTIVGASKLTGRLGRGTSLGVLDAVTQREVGPGDITLEPRTNYFVGRLQQDFRSGASGFGVMVTSVRRTIDSWSLDSLRREAFATGLDFRHQFLDRHFEIAGYAAQSVVSGSAASIQRTQESFVHNYQRPDDDLALDPTRTRLAGSSAQIVFSKRGGDVTRFNTGYQWLSPGFEINDLGFLRAANAHNQFLWFALVFNKPRAFYKSLQVNFNEWTNFTAAGMRTDAGGNVNAHSRLANNMWLHFGQGVNAFAPALCDNCARGGPAVRQERSFWGWAGIEGDERNPIVPFFFTRWSRGDDGRSRGWGLDPSVDLRFASRFSASIGLSYGHDVNATQFNGTFGDIGSDTTHYTFARLDQHTTSMTTRLNFTATPALSLQVYAQPFVSKGDYANWTQLGDPRAPAWEQRYVPYGGGDPGAFNFQQYRSNTVVRWEYRPGSVLYFVWSQDRTAGLDGDDARTQNRTGRIRDIFTLRPTNVFLVKGSYWMSM